MSKLSRRPDGEAIKARRKERKAAQRVLRRNREAAGLKRPARPSIPNRKCPYRNEEEERSARLDAVSQQVKVYRASLPLLSKRLSKIPGPGRRCRPSRRTLRNAENNSYVSGERLRTKLTLLLASC